MPNGAEAWVWMFAFIPLWGVMAGLWFGLASGPKRMAGPRACKVVDAAAVALSVCSASGILLGLKCGSFIELPLSDQACHVAALQLSTWFGL